MSLETRTYIVTGAAGGIGGATAKRLLRTGANVLGVDISQRRLHLRVIRFDSLCHRVPDETRSTSPVIASDCGSRKKAMPSASSSTVANLPSAV